MEGFVINVNTTRGFGHISSGGKSYFFHVRDLRGLELNEQLLQRVVEFEPTIAADGPRAREVRGV